MTVMGRVSGSNGRTRELSAMLDLAWHYSYILKMDALQLGYQEVAHRPQEWASLKPNQVPYILGMRGVEICTLIMLKEVSVGSMKANEVEAIVPEMETPPTIPVDLILGRSFLKNFKLTVVEKHGYFSLT